MGKQDGPSAGIAMVTALLSLAFNRPVHPDLAMTGELTITGKVREGSGGMGGGGEERRGEERGGKRKWERRKRMERANLGNQVGAKGREKKNTPTPNYPPTEYFTTRTRSGLPSTQSDQMGQVLPIGGVKEKTIAAKRSKVKYILLPRENQKNFEELPDYIRDGLTVFYAAYYEDVFDVAFGSAIELKLKEAPSKTSRGRPKTITKVTTIRVRKSKKKEIEGGGDENDGGVTQSSSEQKDVS